MGILPKRGVHIIIIDEHVMYGARLEAQIEQYKKDLEAGKLLLDSCSLLQDQTFSRSEQRITGLGRGMSKTSMLAQAMLAMIPRESEWYIPDGYGDWRDFIQNPARPGRQIKKQKPPKQSFKAQMRSVNRNR